MKYYPVDHKVHFGIGKSVKTACGLIMPVRNLMISVFSMNDPALVTDDVSKVTCKRCLAIKEVRLRKLIEIERLIPGVFDREPLCGEKWILDHALDISKQDIDTQKIIYTETSK